MHEEKPKGFLEELQSLNAVAKKRVLVIGTIIIMVIIVGVWLSYFNGILAGANQATVADDSTTSKPSAPTANGPSMWQNIENSMASIGNVFNSSSQYTVQPSTSSPAAGQAN
jgi:hypothetical protein